jgi:hypothetical protein
VSIRLENPEHLEDAAYPFAKGQPRRREGPWVWAALGAILVVYVFSALLAKPTASFGVMQDDGLYFSSAKALAMGEGYILPGFPVSLRATKYPVLFPLLLSGIWRVDPHFPGNVKFAVGLTLVFGCCFLVIAFLLLREWPGMGDLPALVVAGLCVLSSQFLYLSACVMSDVPFCAVALGSAWLAMRSSLRPGQNELTAMGAGLLAGLSVGVKSLGLGVVAGIALYLLLRRRYRLLAWFCVPALLFSVAWILPELGALPHWKSLVGTSSSGWEQTVCYYSSYPCSWRMGVSNLASLRAIVGVNLTRVVLGPGLYLLTPLINPGSFTGMVLVSLVSVAAYVGMARHVRVACDPMPLIFVFFLLMVVPWPWTPGRFLLVFLPFFFGGLWLEANRCFRSFRHLKRFNRRGERALAGSLAAGVMVVAATILLNHIYCVPMSQHKLGAEHALLLADQQGAYEWIRQHAAPQACILSYQDGLTYLYTGRSSIQPLATLPESFFEHDVRFAKEDAAHLADVARHVDASYWLTSPYDSNAEDPGKFGIVQKRQWQLLAKAPVVYRSADGQVVLYDTRCLWRAERNGCAPNQTGELAGIAGRQ